jgi:hypothetical protein
MGAEQQRPGTPETSLGRQRLLVAPLKIWWQGALLTDYISWVVLQLSMANKRQTDFVTSKYRYQDFQEDLTGVRKFVCSLLSFVPSPLLFPIWNADMMAGDEAALRRCP